MVLGEPEVDSWLLKDQKVLPTYGKAAVSFFFFNFLLKDIAEST